MSRRYKLQIPPTSYPMQCKTAILPPVQAKQIQLSAMHLTNRSGGACDMAIAVLLAGVDSARKFGQFTAPGPAVDATDFMFSGGPLDIFTTAVGDGYIIQSPKPFHIVGFTLSQGQAGAPVYAYQYFNGVAFVPLPATFNTPPYTAGDNVLAFPSPLDWVPGTTAAVGGSPGLYTLFVSATTAGTQVVTATAIWVARLLVFEPALANNQILSLLYDDIYPVILDCLEAVVPYFSVPSANNLVTAKFFDA